MQKYEKSSSIHQLTKRERNPALFDLWFSTNPIMHESESVVSWNKETGLTLGSRAYSFFGCHLASRRVIHWRAAIVVGALDRLLVIFWPACGSL